MVVQRGERSVRLLAGAASLASAVVLGGRPVYGTRLSNGPDALASRHLCPAYAQDMSPPRLFARPSRSRRLGVRLRAPSGSAVAPVLCSPLALSSRLCLISRVAPPLSHVVHASSLLSVVVAWLRVSDSLPSRLYPPV